MKFIKLFSLVFLLLSTNIIIANAQENDLEAQRKLLEMHKEDLDLQMLKYRNGEMSKEQEEKILITLPPEVKSKMEEIKKLDKDKYYRLLNSLKFGYSSAFSQLPDAYWNQSSTKKDFKKEKLLEIDVQLLALKYKNADKASKSKIKKDITTTLSDLFDIREAKKQREVEQLEKRLEKLKESLEARKKNKDVIIERRIQELFGNSKYLEW